MDNALLERIEKLESALAHVERQYEVLNRVVIEQERVLDRLQKHQQRVSDTVETLELERIRSTHTKPPHYQ